MTVFITSHGTAYHRAGRHLFTGSAKREVSRRRAHGAGYVPCQRCFPGEQPKVVRPGRDGARQFKEM